jgi:acetyl esterase
MLIDRSIFDPDRISPETREMREELQRQVGSLPNPWEFDSIDRWRQMMDGRLASAGQSSVAWAEDRSIEGRGGQSVGLRIFAGETVNGVCLYLHGGGYVLGPSPNEEPHASFVEATGVAVVLVDRRLAPEHQWPAPLEDAEDAAVWLVKEAAGEFGTETLFISGTSAGANLAASTLLRLRDRHNYTDWRGAIFNQGEFDMRPTHSKARYSDDPVLPDTIHGWIRDQLFKDDTDLADPELSPVLAELTNLPPALFTIGTIDPLLDGSLNMAVRWETAGNQTDLAIYPGGFHSFDSFPIPIAREAKERILVWVKNRIN